VIYPPFLNGTWKCTRVVTAVEGDAAQALGAWRLLGGDGDLRSPEQYLVRYLDTRNAGSIMGLDGRTYYAVVLDRGFEIDERTHGATATWSAAAPNALSYRRDSGGRGGAADLFVVQRSVETPTTESKGWGSDELLRIVTASGFGEIDYACRVQRRWRRGLTESGERLVEGLEVVKTYRVLDGVAGVEFPTSTKLELRRG